MQPAELLKRLTPRVLATVVAGLLVAVGFLAVFVIPEYRTARRLRQQIAAVRADIKVQTRLIPVWSRVRKDLAVFEGRTFAVKHAPMPLGDVGHLAEIIDDLAKPVGVRVAVVRPQANSAGKNGLLAVDLRVLGPMAALRAFLLQLGGFGPLVAVESATSMVGNDGRELALKCWLAVR